MVGCRFPLTARSNGIPPGLPQIRFRSLFPSRSHSIVRVNGLVTQLEQRIRISSEFQAYLPNNMRPYCVELGNLDKSLRRVPPAQKGDTR